MSSGDSSTQETPQQAQEAQNDAKMWNYVQQNYTPLVDKYIAKQNTDIDGKGEQKNVAGQVNAEVMKGETSAALTNPAQNATVTNDRSNTVAGVESSAQATAAGKVKAQQLQGQQNVIDIGRGQETGAMQDQSQLAGQSLQAAEAGKKDQLQVQGTVENAAGSAVGVAGGLYLRNQLKPQALDGTLPENSSGVMMSDQNPFPESDVSSIPTVNT